MAATRIIEEERGTYVGFVMHAHNSYYAGDFSRRDDRIETMATRRRPVLTPPREEPSS